MSNKFKLIIFLSLSALLTLVADFLGKKWTIDNKFIYFLIASVLILMSGISFLFALRYEKLGIVSVAWDALTSIFLILMGYFIFKEVLTITQIIAVILIFGGMFLLLK